MDGTSFASLAQVRILLIPVGNIHKATFEKWADVIRSFDHIRLDEITPDTSEDKSRFMPTPMSAGYLHLTFPTHPPPSWHASFSLFRPSHFPLGLIGIADCCASPSPQATVSAFSSTLAEYFPKGSAYPLASRCYAFEDGDEPSNVNLPTNLNQLVVIPSVMGNKKMYIGTLISELCGEILGAFTGLAKALESPTGLEALNSRLLPQIAYSDEPEGVPFSFESRTWDVPSTIQVPNGSGVETPRNSGDFSQSNGLRPTPKRSGTTSSARSSLAPAPVNTKKRISIGLASGASGRAYKLVADLFLLAGRTSDAVQWYMESLPLLKGTQDVIWQASAIEGMCVAEILDTWSSGDGAQTIPPGGKQPWADMSDRLNQVVSLYAKATPSITPIAPNSTAQDIPFDGELTALSFLYCQSVLRHSQFLLAVWTARGWGKMAFETMLSPDLPPIFAQTTPTEAILSHMSSASSIPRSTIANVINQAHGPHLMHLQSQDRLQVLNTMAAMYSFLGFKRKEVYVLREVLAVAMDMLVVCRDDSMQVAVNGTGKAPGLAITGVDMGALTSSPKVPPSSGTVGVRHSVDEDGNESVLKVVRYIGETYGIDFGKVGIVKADAPSARESLQDVSPPGGSVKNDDDDDAAGHYGWPELQIGVVREAVVIAEALPDYPTVAQFAFSTLKALYPYLTPSEQAQFYAAAGKALATARRRGDERKVEYWAGRPVLSLEVTPLPHHRLPIEHSITDLEPSVMKSASTVTGRRDPFIYNPRLKAASTTQATIVQHEPVEFVLTLFNPFSFDLEIHNLFLSTTGVAFDCPGVPTSIPAESYRVLRLTGTASEPGSLVVRGIKAQLPGGVVREFLLPMSTDEEDKQAERRKSLQDAEGLRTKYYGLEARLSDKTGKRLSLTEKAKALVKPVTPSFLTCKVVEQQPLLRIRRTTLTHGALMLYNGERSTIRLTLENISTIPVDFLKLGFDDSTISAAQHMLTEGDLSVAEAYETEYDLVHRPVFTWQGTTDQSILPDKKAIVTVTCLGKYGCTSGSVQLSYAFARRLREAQSGVFHTRQLLYPIEITVYQTLECYSLDIIPCWQTLESSSAKDEVELGGGNLSAQDEHDWCLFNIDVHNQYVVPFEVIFERDQEGVPPASASRLVAPGATVRVVLPLRRIILSDSTISQAIPTLSNRQFVVSKEKLSSVEEHAQRELFWYRERLLDSVKARWKEPGTSRHGELSLRNQRLTLPMLEALRVARCRIDLSLVSTSGETPVRCSGRRFFTQPYIYHTMRAHITNTSNSPMSLTLSYVPSSLSLLDSALFDSFLSQIPIGTIGPGDTWEEDVGVYFIDEGEFNFKAHVEVVGKGPLRGVEGSICVVAQQS